MALQRVTYSCCDFPDCPLIFTICDMISSCFILLHHNILSDYFEYWMLIPALNYVCPYLNSVFCILYSFQAVDWRMTARSGYRAAKKKLTPNVQVPHNSSFTALSLSLSFMFIDTDWRLFIQVFLSLSASTNTHTHSPTHTHTASLSLQICPKHTHTHVQVHSTL